MIQSNLPRATSVLAICAHPDDESFGLGAILSAFVEQGARTAVLCFTHGEASTLHATEGELAEVRARELARAAEVLGVWRSELLDYRDGHLADEPRSELTAHAVRMAQEVGADLLLVFDEGGITGHPDHVRATDAALSAAASLGVPVLAWAVPDTAARSLNEELETGFVGRGESELDFAVFVNRYRQREAIACHESQSAWNPVLERRLELSGEVEHLHWLRKPAS